jgi:hypothetical protein
MRNTEKNKELNDKENIKNFLVKLGFICNSSPSSQHLIYSKNGEVIIIKNSKKLKR